MTLTCRSRLHIDIETFSSVDISSGVYKYSESNDFQILLFAYSYDDGPVQQLDLTKWSWLPDEICRDLLDPEVIKVAHNAAFERVCLSRYMRDYWFEPWEADDVKDWYLDPKQWECTMCHASMLGLPSSLDKLGKAIGLAAEEQKLKTGKTLIKYFSVPRKPTKNNPSTRNMPEDNPERWELYKEYNLQDVVTEKAIDRYLEPYPIPDKERLVYAIDQRINDTGVRIAMDLVEKIQNFSFNHTLRVSKDFYDLTGIEKIKAVGQVKSWLSLQGVNVPNLQKETLQDLLQTDLPGKVREAINLKLEASKTSMAKYESLQNSCCEGDRVHGLFQYYGSRTGRWAGRGVQPQNLPRNEFEDFDYCRQLVVDDAWEEFEMSYGSPSGAFATLIRTMFIPADGHVFAVADYAAIEARVIAWLAGEQWRQEAFRDGKDIYCESASMMFHVPVEKHGQNSHLRKKGKVAELALGYQGGVGALKKMGGEKMGLSDAEMEDIKVKWRKASPAIVRLWEQIQAAADKAVTCHTETWINDKVLFGYKDSCLTVKLPSGRVLYYKDPEIKTIRKRSDKSLWSYQNISVQAKNREAAFAQIRQQTCCTIDDLKETECFYDSTEIFFWGSNQTTKKYERIGTYSGKLTENIIQAIARDCLAETLIKLARFLEYRIVMHVHDEVILEVPETDAAKHLKQIEAVMAEPIPWAEGLILTADGFTSSYYRKD